MAPTPLLLTEAGHRSTHNSPHDFKVANLEDTGCKVAVGGAAPAIDGGHPSDPLRGINDGALGTVIGLDFVPVTGKRGPVLSYLYQLPISGHSHDTVHVSADSHPEGGSPIVRVLARAAPVVAARAASSLHRVKGSRAPTVAISLDPVNLCAPLAPKFLCVTVVSLGE